jgi:chemotaxis protein CheX
MEEYIQVFIDVTASVFKEFLQLDVKTERIFFMKKDDLHDWDISGIIGITGEASGAVAISMKTETALKITGLLTGEAHTDIDDAVKDAIGELVNIIAGNVKKYLEEMFKLVISLPSIVSGKDHKVVWPNEKNRIVCIPFTLFSNETICLSIAMTKLER